LSKIPCYYISIIAHKILHSPKIIEEMALLSIEMLFKEAQEAKNKDIKKYREGFFRKCLKN
jgi:hypothetical protein